MMSLVQNRKTRPNYVLHIPASRSQYKLDCFVSPVASTSHNIQPRKMQHFSVLSIEAD
jgi:hypothetical protein